MSFMEEPRERTFERICRLYRSGLSIREIAKRERRSRAYLADLLRKDGIDTSKKKQGPR